MKQKQNQKNRYTTEFKEEAVARCQENGTAQTSEELGVHVGTLNRWRNELGTNPTRPQADGKAKSSYEELEKENRRLKKELGYVNEINRVLKKSTAIFSSAVLGDLK